MIPRLERVTLHAQLQRAPIVRVSLRRETVQSKRSIVIRAVAVGDGELFARDDVGDASRLGETKRVDIAVRHPAAVRRTVRSFDIAIRIPVER